MKKIKSCFVFSSEQRSGIFVLLALILITSFLMFFSDSIFEVLQPKSNQKDNKEWLAFQTEVDSIKKVKQNQKFQIQPFNPNFISDYKGYQLGMTETELDRLFAFRKQNKFVNSAKEFQQVTQISDSLLAAISPYFKFPDWVKNKQSKNSDFIQNSNSKYKQAKIEKINLNSASKEDLMKVYGIGDKLSDIILRDKEKFGTYVSLDQLQFVWGISPETFENIKKYFFVEADVAKLKKLKINQASINEIKQFPYFNYYLAKDIVTYRSMNGKITTINDLTKIKDFPQEKLQIIALYLELD
ncbi:ComEA family DNA-binding protein [Flavobacterium sp.]|uniref:ComEA family DNA-binding protein n=1 Tax=Flavobacterium sp. TaxID=239 RepID=UPI003527BD2D